MDTTECSGSSDRRASWPRDRCVGGDDRCPRLIALLGELQPPDIDLYPHQQALDTRHAGRMLFGMLAEFSEREIRDRDGGGWIERGPR